MKHAIAFAGSDANNRLPMMHGLWSILAGSIVLGLVSRASAQQYGTPVKLGASDVLMPLDAPSGELRQAVGELLTQSDKAHVGYYTLRTQGKLPEHANEFILTRTEWIKPSSPLGEELTRFLGSQKGNVANLICTRQGTGDWRAMIIGQWRSDHVPAFAAAMGSDLNRSESSCTVFGPQNAGWWFVGPRAHLIRNDAAIAAMRERGLRIPAIVTLHFRADGKVEIFVGDKTGARLLVADDSAESALFDPAIAPPATIASEVKIDKPASRPTRDDDDSVRADSELSLARNYARAGRLEQAKARFRKIVQTWPDTPQARSARDELAKIGE